jgi:hypothetical protein
VSKKSFIDSVEVKNPCSEDWNEMSGNDTVRFCSHCSKSVNNLSEMTRKQAMRLVRSNRDLCIRYVADSRTQRPLFAEQLLQITRRAPSVAAGVMTASIALSTHTYAQDRPAGPPALPVSEIALDRDRTAIATGEASTKKPLAPASIVGTVSDQTGAVIPNAKIAIFSVKAEKMAETQSNENGQYKFSNLGSGQYRIEASFPGFNVHAREIAVGFEGEVKSDLELLVGGFALTVEVTGGDPQISQVVSGGMAAVAYKSELTIAVADEDLDEVRSIINRGADVNEKEPSYEKITPLFIAVETGNLEIVRLLLDHGAKVNARDSEKQTPIMRLDEDATPELIDLLINRGAKVDLADKAGNTALILAAGSVPSEALAKLIAAGADVNAANKQGQTALMNAAEYDLLESVRALLAAGAKVNAKNKDGETAWDLAGEDEVVTLIETHGGISGSSEEKDDTGNL